MVALLDLRMEARAAAAGHSGSLLTRLDLGTEAWAAAAGHSGAVLTRLDLRMEMGGGPFRRPSLVWCDFASLLDDCICNGRILVLVEFQFRQTMEFNRCTSQHSLIITSRCQ